MKITKKVLLACLFTALTMGIVFAFGSKEPAPEPEKGDVVISFDYEKQSGYASNQFAVWIEDSKGNVIKPLFVTKYTGKGNWKKRPELLPDWVSSLGQKSDLDTMSGSTPKPGRMEYIWDCTDTDGNLVPDATYVFIVEASLRWENRVIFEESIELDREPFTVNASPEYFGEETEDRGMIQNVFATLVE